MGKVVCEVTPGSIMGREVKQGQQTIKEGKEKVAENVLATQA